MIFFCIHNFFWKPGHALVTENDRTKPNSKKQLTVARVSKDCRMLLPAASNLTLLLTFYTSPPDPLSGEENNGQILWMHLSTGQCLGLPIFMPLRGCRGNIRALAFTLTLTSSWALWLRQSAQPAFTISFLSFSIRILRAGLSSCC